MRNTDDSNSRYRTRAVRGNPRYPGQRARDQQSSSPARPQPEKLQQLAVALDAGQLKDVAFDQRGQIGIEERRSPARGAPHGLGKATDDNALQIMTFAQFGGVHDPRTAAERRVNEMVWPVAELPLRERPQLDDLHAPW